MRIRERQKEGKKRVIERRRAIETETLTDRRGTVSPKSEVRMWGCIR